MKCLHLKKMIRLIYDISLFPVTTNLHFKIRLLPLNASERKKKRSSLAINKKRYMHGTQKKKDNENYCLPVKHAAYKQQNAVISIIRTRYISSLVTSIFFRFICFWGVQSKSVIRFWCSNLVFES